MSLTSGSSVSSSSSLKGTLARTWGKLRSVTVAEPLYVAAGFGMYIKYLMAGFLAVFAISMLVQFTSYLLDAVADWRGQPGGHAHDATHAS